MLNKNMSGEARAADTVCLGNNMRKDQLKRMRVGAAEEFGGEL